MGDLSKSCTTDIRLTFHGEEWVTNSSTTQYVRRYVGTRDLCHDSMQNFVIGDQDQFGTVESVRVYQDNYWWILEVTYGTNSYNNHWHYPSDGEESGSATGTSKTATRSELTARTISLPLENNINYKKNWNYNLYTTTGVTTVPDWWTTADKHFIAPTGYYFARSFSEVPVSGPVLQIAAMTKPGVEGWDFPTYSIRESSRHNKKSDASWVLSDRIGKICSPIKGDFDIVERYGGNWLCDSGSVIFDGKKWQADLQYTWGGPNGFDTTIYPVRNLPKE